MPTGQALINVLQASGAIGMTGGQQPTFTVSFPLLRAAFQPEQAGMLTAMRTAVQAALAASTPVVIAPSLKQRTDTGNIVLTPPGGAATTIPVIILLGADGAGSGGATWPGMPRKGETIILDERTRNGYILIAAGGNGAAGSDGGSATVIGDAEGLIVALGGNGAAGATGQAGSNGGDGTSAGIGSGNDLFAEGGRGGSPGGTGAPGTPAMTAGFRLPAVPAAPGGPGGAGGNGGKANVSGGDSSYASAHGGNGGAGGPGGRGGAGAPAVTALGGKITLWPAVPPAANGGAGNGGDGGDYHLTVGANSKVDPACSGGSAGAAGGPLPAVAGTAGVKT
jgi:hypothetical protein